MSISIHYCKTNKKNQKYLKFFFYKKNQNRKGWSPGIFIYDETNREQFTRIQKKHNKITLKYIEELKVEKESELAKCQFINEIFEKKMFLENYQIFSNRKGNLHISAYKSIKKYINYKIGKDIATSDLDKSLIIGYLDYLEEHGKKPRTINNYFGSLKSFFYQEFYSGHIDRVPFLGIKKKKVPYKIPVSLEQEDIDKLMSIENKPEVLKSYLFSTLTGLRFSDSKELKYSDLTHNRLKKVQRKTNKPLDNPLSTKVWDLVDKDKVSQDKLVFELGYNSSMNYELKKLVESVDIKKHITFRTSRNTFAQRLSNIEPNLKTVSSLMGHQYINTTLGYVHATDAEKSNAINKL